MTSCIHDAVICEMRKNKSKEDIIKDLVISICALSFFELASTAQSTKFTAFSNKTGSFEISFKVAKNKESACL